MINQEVDKLLRYFVDQSKKILQENLVGVYLHGSAVMGCFNINKSDIDIIIVVKQPLQNYVKKEYMDMVVECNSLTPIKGIEMSIVLREVCNPFVYPTPFELHFSVKHLKWYKDIPQEYILKMNGYDKDLAAHFTILNKRGTCIHGIPIKEVFAEVPSNNYFDSIWNDIAEAPENIAKDTMYLTLNLARVLAYKEEGLILSKQEGGEWAMKHLPKKFHSLVKDSLFEYIENRKAIYDKVLATSFAEYAINRIKGN